MRYILFLSINVLLSCSLTGQQTFNDSIARYRYRLTEKAMITLGGWADWGSAIGFKI